MTRRTDVWTAALIGLLRRSGAEVADRPTLDDVVAAADHLGIDVGELLDAADAEARSLLGTVQD